MTVRTVLIRCDAGGVSGLGHASRCVTLARALRRTGAEVEFVVQPGSPAGANFIAEQGFPVEISPARAGDPADVDFVTARLKRTDRRPALVLDSRDLEPAAPQAYRGAAITLCIDDELMRDLECDLLLNSHPWPSSVYSKRAGRALLIGSRYNLVAEAFFHSRSGRDPARDPERVLLTMGGEDPGNHTRAIIERGAEHLRSRQVDIVVGPSHPDPQSVAEAAALLLPNARLHHAPSGLADLVAGADIALTAGGTTCYELAAARVPMAAVAIEPHQCPLLEWLEQAGVLMRLDPANAGIVDCAVIAQLLADGSLRQHLVAASAALMPGPGADVIAECLCEALTSERITGASAS